MRNSINSLLILLAGLADWIEWGWGRKGEGGSGWLNVSYLFVRNVRKMRKISCRSMHAEYETCFDWNLFKSSTEHRSLDKISFPIQNLFGVSSSSPGKMLYKALPREPLPACYRSGEKCCPYSGHVQRCRDPTNTPNRSAMQSIFITWNICIVLYRAAAFITIRSRIDNLPHMIASHRYCFQSSLLLLLQSIRVRYSQLGLRCGLGIVSHKWNYLSSRTWIARRAHNASENNRTESVRSRTGSETKKQWK